MSGQLRALKSRIRSVESTKKITRAMEMVSASKLKRFQTLLAQATPYAETLTGLLGRLLKTGIEFKHPLLEERPEKEAALLIITSDTGLCGSYNVDIVQEARRFIKTKKRPLTLVGYGKNGVASLSRIGFQWFRAFTDTKTPDINQTVKRIEMILEALFREKNVDAVYVTHAKAISQSSYQAVTEKILPFRVKKPGKEEGPEVDYILEPNAEFLFTKLIPLAFEAHILEMFFEAFVAEQTLRMHAMHLATENATELVDSLVLLRNKLRQATITKELIEIVSGSKALKTG
jgi:F-type H+-transporting ATPase subunit gamma